MLLTPRPVVCRPPHRELGSAARRQQPVTRARSGQGGGSEQQRQHKQRRRIEKVDLVVPGQYTLPAANLTQSKLDTMLDKLGAVGFERADGRCSLMLEDLPEGGTVRLILPRELPLSTQFRNLQQAVDNSTRGREYELGAFLRVLAATENAGGAVITLPCTPFKDLAGQDYLQLDAGVRAGSTLYVGEMKRSLHEAYVDEVAAKLPKIRYALKRGVPPDLAAALQGVTQVKLYLGGEVVRAGLTVEELIDVAAAEGVGVVLPSGQGLGCASHAAAVGL